MVADWASGLEWFFGTTYIITYGHRIWTRSFCKSDILKTVTRECLNCQLDFVQVQEAGYETGSSILQLRTTMIIHGQFLWGTTACIQWVLQQMKALLVDSKAKVEGRKGTLKWQFGMAVYIKKNNVAAVRIVNFTISIDKSSNF